MLSVESCMVKYQLLNCNIIAKFILTDWDYCLLDCHLSVSGNSQVDHRHSWWPHPVHRDCSVIHCMNKEKQSFPSPAVSHSSKRKSLIDSWCPHERPQPMASADRPQRMPLHPEGCQLYNQEQAHQDLSFICFNCSHHRWKVVISASPIWANWPSPNNVLLLGWREAEQQSPCMFCQLIAIPGCVAANSGSSVKQLPKGSSAAPSPLPAGSSVKSWAMSVWLSPSWLKALAFIPKPRQAKPSTGRSKSERRDRILKNAALY